MEQGIIHGGIIERIDGKHISVRIVQKAACASCSISKQCTASESKVKVIDVWTADASRYAVGQEVNVSLTTGMARGAVLLSFVYPTLIIVAVIVAVLCLTSPGGPWPLAAPYSEMAAALAGIASLIPYFAILFSIRKKLRQRFMFSISPKAQT
ncbi:MAG: SoxR reducing system RseC family protein [Prevotella sp.]